MSVSPDAREDALGLLCPLPVLRVKAALALLPPGGVVELWSDDPGILRDLPDFCAGSGHDLLEMHEDTAARRRVAWRCLVRRGGC